MGARVVGGRCPRAPRQARRAALGFCGRVCGGQGIMEGPVEAAPRPLRLRLPFWPICRGPRGRSARFR
eukprot:4669473-Lingulodinium_polyedra.AAC.1